LLSFKRGVAVASYGVSTLKIVPPLTIQTDLFGAALDIVKDVINEVAKEG
jgi:4-aminobutyrate aminotransferase-like enzyme